MPIFARPMLRPILFAALASFLAGASLGYLLAPPEGFRTLPNPPPPALQSGPASLTTTESVVITLPDGSTVRAPAGSSIVHETTRGGARSEFESQGSARSPGLSTSAEGVVGSSNLSAGAAPTPLPPGVALGGGDPASGGALSWKGGPTQNLVIQILGVLIALAGVAGFVVGRKFGVGLSLAQAGCVVGVGALVVLLGRMSGEQATAVVLSLVGVLALGAGVYLWTTWRAGKVSDKLSKTRRSAGLIAKVVDDLDSGKTDTEGNPLSPGGLVKQEVSKRSAGLDIEQTIDEIVAEFGA